MYSLSDLNKVIIRRESTAICCDQFTNLVLFSSASDELLCSRNINNIQWSFTLTFGVTTLDCLYVKSFWTSFRARFWTTWNVQQRWTRNNTFIFFLSSTTNILNSSIFNCNSFSWQLPLNKLFIYWKNYVGKPDFFKTCIAFRLLYGKKNKKAVAFLIRNRTRVKIVILFLLRRANKTWLGRIHLTPFCNLRVLTTPKFSNL